jgi:hypothetical protein
VVPGSCEKIKNRHRLKPVATFVFLVAPALAGVGRGFFHSFLSPDFLATIEVCKKREKCEVPY